MNKMNYFLLLSLLHQNLYSSDSSLDLALVLLGAIEQSQNSPIQPPEGPSDAPLQLSITVVHAFFACPNTECDYVAPRKDRLTRHMLIHSGERSFVCGVCHNRFSRYDNLQVHEKIHRRGEKKPTSYADSPQLPCQFPGCRKSFVKPAHLRRHMVTHSDARPYACNFPGCTQAFKLAEGLSRHNRMHLRSADTPADTDELSGVSWIK
jgi:uncharacterized Zn-finger protein